MNRCKFRIRSIACKISLSILSSYRSEQSTTSLWYLTSYVWWYITSSYKFASVGDDRKKPSLISCLNQNQPLSMISSQCQGQYLMTQIIFWYMVQIYRSSNWYSRSLSSDDRYIAYTYMIMIRSWGMVVYIGYYAGYGCQIWSSQIYQYLMRYEGRQNARRKIHWCQSHTPFVVRFYLFSQYRLQIEPWTRFVANVWYIVAQIVDITDTGSDGYQFVKLNTGMNDIIRPTMYGARHPIYPCLAEYQDNTSYVIVWHCCESWDTITVDMDWDPLETSLPQVHIWDWLIIWWCGAYCASMSCKWYNDYPTSPEYFVK